MSKGTQKDRARARALKRSKKNGGDRFSNRAERAVLAPAARELEEELRAARTERDQLLASANEAFRKGVKELEKIRAETRASAWAGYEERKDKALQKYGRKAEDTAA